MKKVLLKILSKTPYATLSELSRLLLKLMGFGRIPTIQEEVKFLTSLTSGLGKFVFIDVGANRGDYSLEFSKKFSNVPIYAFEPALETFKILQSKTQKTSISCINLGIGEKSKSAELYYDFFGSGLASLSQRDLSHIKVNFDLHEIISIVTLDEWLINQKIRDDLVVKMDIEGFELFALKGAQEALKAQIQLIQFEFGGANIDSRTFFKDFWLLLSPRFEIYRLSTKGLDLLSHYSEGCEIFTNTTYYAQRKN
jgi:FkbM family methyltransferase